MIPATRIPKRMPIIALVACLTAFAGCKSKSTESAPTQTQSAQTQAGAGLANDRRDAEEQLRPEIEAQRKQERTEAQNRLSENAITAITDTRNAIDAIGSGNKDKALSEIEDATGKLSILLATNPATALIPVQSEVDVIDNAPQDDKAVKGLIDNAKVAVIAGDYATARVLLDDLMSEIRVRTYNLPLGTYPEALKDAARLLNNGKDEEASAALLTALNTLVIVDQVTPIPLILARAAVDAAQQKSHADKSAASTLLETARNQLRHCSELGYSTKAPEYTSLNSQISNLEKQLKGNGDTSSLFARLKEDLSNFFHKQANQQHR